MGAESALGNHDFSAAMGNFGGADFAGAGAVNGNNNLAVMVGTNSNANAFDGNRNLAAVLGNDLSATAMGGSMTDIVTFLGTM